MNVLMNEMKEKGIFLNVVIFGISINYFCKFGRIDEVMDLFEKMKGGKVGVMIESDVVIYNIFIDGLCKVGCVEEGLVFMRKMVLESKYFFIIVIFNCLIDGFCKVSEFERFFELFYGMNKEGV